MAKLIATDSIRFFLIDFPLFLLKKIWITFALRYLLLIVPQLTITVYMYDRASWIGLGQVV